jgi:hypothetical protein
VAAISNILILMINKIKRLLAIPAPHRKITLVRHFLTRYPNLKNWLVGRCEKKISARSEQDFTGSLEGSRYMASYAHRTAGIGHVLAEYNSGVYFAKRFGLEFLHSKLEEPWESFLGIGSQSSSVEDLWQKGGFELVQLPPIQSNSGEGVQRVHEQIERIRSHKPILFMLHYGQNLFEHHKTGAQLRKVYWEYQQRPNATILREPGRINVAVHIRRRNTMDMKNPSVHDTNSAAYRSRYIELDYFEQLMSIISKVVPEPVFHIFSQGTPDGFEPLLAFKDVRLHLDVDQYNTFHNMAASDILITSPSSFSFKAGMLSPGLKLARYPWWHEIPEDAEWCRIPEEPKLEAERISKFIQSNLPTAQASAAKLYPFAL